MNCFSDLLDTIYSMTTKLETYHPHTFALLHLHCEILRQPNYKPIKSNCLESEEKWQSQMWHANTLEAFYQRNL